MPCFCFPTSLLFVHELQTKLRLGVVYVQKPDQKILLNPYLEY
jgi:hypothetical protein